MILIYGLSTFGGELKKILWHYLLSQMGLESQSFWLIKTRFLIGCELLAEIYFYLQILCVGDHGAMD